MEEPTIPPLRAPDARERVVVAGIGRLGLEVASALELHPGTTLAGWVEPRADRCRFARGAGFRAPAEATLARWLQRHAADSLVVCAPIAERAAIARGALDAGLPVLVCGLTALPSAEAEELTARLESAGSTTGAAAPVLSLPLFARARRSGVLAPGRLTRLRASASVSRVFSASAAPEGDVLDFLLADLLQLTDAAGGPLVEVRATGQALYGEWLDEVQVECRTATGLASRLEASWSVPDYPGVSLVLEAEGAGLRVLVSDDALEVEQEGGTGRIVAASEPALSASDLGDASRIVEAWVRARAGDDSLAESLSVARARRVSRVLEAVRASLAAAGEWRTVRP